MKVGNACPKCGGELHLWEDRYERGDGRWLVCEELDCDYERRVTPCDCGGTRPDGPTQCLVCGGTGYVVEWPADLPPPIAS